MKSKIYILFVIGILTLTAADLNAQVRDGSFSITPVVGYSDFAERSVYEDTETYGAAIGYNFSQRFGIEATYNTLDTEIIPEGVTVTGSDPDGPGPMQGEVTIVTPGGTEVDAYQTALEMLFYIFPGKKFAPYAAVGVGITKYEYDGESITKANEPVGFGCKYFVTDTIAVRADVRSALPMDKNNLRATVGVTFQFGGK